MVATDAGTIVSGTAAEFSEVSSIERVVATTDHKVVGRLFVGFGLLGLMLALAGAAISRIGGAADPILGEWTSGVSHSSQLALLTLGIIPVTIGLGLYLAPLQIGAQGSSFPRGALLAFWTWMVSSVIFIVSVLNDGGIGGRSDEMSRLGMTSLAGQIAALILGLAIVQTTIFTLRTSGMNLRRIPLLSFSLLVSSFVWIVTMAVMAAELIEAFAQRPGAQLVRDQLVPKLGFLNWAPTAVAVAIPVLGIVGDIVVTQSHRRLLNRDIFQDLIAVFGVATIGVWAADATLAVNNSLWSIMAVIAVMAVLGYIGGLAMHARGGTVSQSSGLLLSLIALIMLILCVISGVVAMINNFGSGTDGALGLGDVNGLNAEAQFGFAVGAAIAGLIAAVFHWGPKMFGSAPQQSVGSVIAPLVLAGGLLAGGSGVVSAVGAAADSDVADISSWLSVAGLVLLALAAFMTVLATSRALRSGDDNPWDGQTLEWATTSPPPDDNFPGVTPAVMSAAPLLDSAEKGDA